MSRPDDERPIFWIIAGPNGSGKTSLYQRADIEDFGSTVWIINPDLLAARIRTLEMLTLPDANLQAVRRIEAWLQSSINAYQTIGVETVLSTSKYRRLVEAAKSRKFEIRLIYVFLRSAALQIERVRLRVAKGGHSVPVGKIRSRRTRSFAQLPWFLEQADQAWMFDNSGAAPVLVGSKKGGVIELDPAAIADLKTAIEQIRSE